jgi:hypothetical protein
MLLKVNAYFNRAALIFLVAIFASTSTGVSVARDAAVYTIRNDRGGVVIDYAIRKLKLEREKRFVRFDGRCDSACTLFLALDNSQTCLTASARFGFHLPFGSTPRGNKVAASFLMKHYPRWVHNWLRANGGLSNRVKVMPHDYASQFIKPCGSETASL